VIFLIDENISPKVVSLHSKTHRAIHINQLKPDKKAIIKDDLIRKLSLDHPFVLVTRDDDFVKSWVDRKVPQKVIFIHDDFNGLASFLSAYKKGIPLLEQESLDCDFLEFSSKGIRKPFEMPLPYRKAGNRNAN
jgi:hypothetical protein